jgi:uncharacterized protein YfaA (DUF2138 family)
MSKPIRIQRKRTKGWKMPKNTVYVGRPSKFGNPFVVGKLPQGDWAGIVAFPVTVEQAVGLYRRYFAETWRMGVIQEELRGKNLACWCEPSKPCHADVLLEIANQ